MVPCADKSEVEYFIGCSVVIKIKKGNMVDLWHLLDFDTCGFACK